MRHETGVNGSSKLLPLAYFAGILDHMSGKSFCTLYFAEDKLLAANILVHNESTLIDKFFCMDGEEGRAYDLYYLSWFANLRYCIDHRIARYQSGQAYYENKLRLGSRLTANTMYFKHRNKGAQWLLEACIADVRRGRASGRPFMSGQRLSWFAIPVLNTLFQIFIKLAADAAVVVMPAAGFPDHSHRPGSLRPLRSKSPAS